MRVELGSNIAIYDDDGKAIKEVDGQVKAHLEVLHEECRKSMEDYVKQALRKPDASDYDRAMSAVI